MCTIFILGSRMKDQFLSGILLGSCQKGKRERVTHAVALRASPGENPLFHPLPFYMAIPEAQPKLRSREEEVHFSSRGGPGRRDRTNF